MTWFTLLFFFTLLIIAALRYPAESFAIYKDFRWLRVLHYLLTFFLGMVMALSLTRAAIPDQFILHVVLSNIAILAAAFFCIVNNNLNDVAIDKISNPNRPHITLAINLSAYKNLGNISACVALIFAKLVNNFTLFSTCAVMIIYYLYSTPPIRFKRLYIVSKASIALNSVLMLLMGYYLYAGSLHHISFVSLSMYFFGVILAANLIDIKDILGDKSAGIITLANHTSIKLSSLIISVGFMLAYLGFYFLIGKQNIYFFTAIFLASLLQVGLLILNPYREQSILLFYLICLTLAITALLF